MTVGTSRSRLRRTAVRAAIAALAAAGLLGTVAPTALAAAPVTAVAGAPAGPALPATESSTPDGALDGALRAVVAEGGAAAVQAEVREDGRRVWRGAAGVADLRTGAPVPDEARFRIGSVTKTFAATVVLQLVAEGKVGLDTPVERYLPGVVPNGAAITVRRLLNHTSGLYNFTDDARFGTEGAAADRWLRVGRWTTYRPQDVVALATAHPPYSEPGAWHYSNTNYVLLGMIVQRATGHTWADEVERRVIRPLGLHGTSMPDSSPFVPGPHAHGYLPRPGGPVDVTLQNPSAFGPAGAGISTTADLARFNAALLGGRLLGPAELAEMKRQVAADNGGTYGLGLVRYPTACGEFWGLSGGLPGYGTIVLGDAAGHRQAAVSITPLDLTEATGRTLQALIDTATCGSAAATAAPAGPAR
ncbi:serine hydrolase domain-containing protein [Kitasatospora sp. NPDC059327]|uniref:serine hydrolase domain-containing protein n=1 Tax=Kitasatospora sp. NPDC059327 TaxID=3346803 RepID=UPI0036BB134D